MTTTSTPVRGSGVAETPTKGNRALRYVLAFVAVIAVIAGFMFLTTESIAELEAEALDELLTQEQEILEVYYANADPSVYVAMYADEMTYFDPWSGGKLENQAARDHNMSFAGGFPPFGFEIINPSVDLFEDTAIFAFNVNVFSPEDGSFVQMWNTTEIHRRTADGWELVHAHWAVDGGEVPAAAATGA